MGKKATTLANSVREIKEDLEQRFKGILETEYCLAKLTTYGVGGAAALFAEPQDQDDLELLRDTLAVSELPHLFLGRGSNLLISDRGFRGVVIRLGSGFNWWRSTETGAAAGGATPLPAFSRWCASGGLSGIEFAVGIPGSVGGAVRMNAGGHGVEICDVLERLTITDLNGSSEELLASEIEFSYRQSSIPPTAVVTSASFRLSAGDIDQIKRVMADIIRWRRKNQPGGAANAGSIFKNPDGDFAGRLIDAAGLKGLRIGSAEVSLKHGNFFLVHEGARASDVAALIGMVRKRVYETSGVLLEPEIRLVGEFEEWAEPET